MRTSMKDAYLYQEPHPLVIWNNMNQHEHCGGAREPLKKYSARESESSDQTKFSTSPLEKLKYTMYVELGMTAVVLVLFDPEMTSKWPRMNQTAAVYFGK